MWELILKVVAAIVGVLKPLLLPLAFLFGKRAGKKERDLEIAAENAELQETYAEIGVQHVTDEELDAKLEKGEF
jgi:hypothetical protein